MQLIPLYDRIVVKMTNQEIKSGTGIVITKDLSTTSHTTIVAEVVAVGDGKLLQDGTLAPLKVKVGDKVVFTKMTGESFNDGENDYTILSESGVLAILKEEENEYREISEIIFFTTGDDLRLGKEGLHR